MPNRLANSISPYLAAHAENPVDWWTWSDEAFAEARRRDVPIFLSVGYAACHWCHVMAHESFEDPAVATLLNENFVSIKVDREERPDVDDVYMRATVAMTRHGGWPMSVFLDHDRSPFYAGTYFPPEPRHGMPSFSELLVGIAQAWRLRRDEVSEVGQSLLSHLRQRPDATGQAFDAGRVDEAVRAIAGQFDPQWGGFGRAPKFPQPTVLEFLLRHHVRTGDPDSLRMTDATLRHMAGGGVYDQLGGGFARYSVDGSWTVPHFEKMLYDNALLLGVYTHWWQVTGSDLARRVVNETAEFLLRDLLTATGGFAAALDADSEGREGAFYVWTPEQVQALGGDCDLLGVTEAGTFEAGESVLQLRGEPTDTWPEVRLRMWRARQERPAPARDDKVVTSWNAWTIDALARAGAVFDRPDWVAAATACADMLWERHWDGQVLRRVSRDGVAGSAVGVLADYAAFAQALFTLHAVTGRPLEQGLAVVDVMRQQFLADGVLDTIAGDVPAVPAEISDSPVPSGWSCAVQALLTAAILTQDQSARARAESLLSEAIERCGHPLMAGHLWAVADSLLTGPYEVAVVDTPGGPLHRAALHTCPAGSVLALEGPMLAGKTHVSGHPAVYVCRASVCGPPITRADALGPQLGYTRGVGSAIPGSDPA